MIYGCSNLNRDSQEHHVKTIYVIDNFVSNRKPIRMSVSDREKWYRHMHESFLKARDGTTARCMLLCLAVSRVNRYNQGVTGCGSQRRQYSCYSTKTHVNSIILIHKLNLTSLRIIYNKSGLRWAPHTCYVFVEHHTHVMSSLSTTHVMSSLRTTTCDSLIVPSESEPMFVKWKLT